MAGFIQRTTAPAKGNKYYTRTDSGGYSKCCAGNTAKLGLLWTGTVLPNCVGYACGRFNEISGADAKTGYWGLNCNAKGFVDRAKSIGLQTGTAPKEGAIIVWSNSGCGHVAVVEKVYYYKAEGKKIVGKIKISQSGWSAAWPGGFKTADHYYDSSVSGYNANGDKDWLGGESWYSGRYTFVGFVYNPKIGSATLDADLLELQSSIAQSSTSSGTSLFSKTSLQQYNETLVKEHQALIDTQNTKGLDLLTSGNVIETPFIIAKIGDYTFGSYTTKGSLENSKSSQVTTFPNYMNSMTVVKTNGQLNQYTLKMIYQVAAGNDPNLLDKIFSSVGISGEITLSYGDWSAPSFIFKEEKAIITKVSSDIDFASQRITYTIECQSSALAAAAAQYDFPVQTKKGSDVIKNVLLKDNHYGLLSVFPAMKDKQAIANNGWIAGDDKVVTIPAQKNLTAIEYLNYVVGCMSANTSGSGTLKDSTYHLVISDDIGNEYGGQYFKVVKIGTSTKTLVSANMYEVDIGYPTSTLVTNFKINQDDSWSILYDYAGQFSTDQYKYTIDNDGVMHTESKSAIASTTDEIEKTWWTAVTAHPITATLTIKGLLRPAILMEYVRINAYFYGQKHISSGVYAITKQEDEINESGYRTTLSLTRINDAD